ncbi:MAG TPA: YHYH protein [Pirellulaceae bacterium]|jgi:hypothetical protein
MSKSRFTGFLIAGFLLLTLAYAELKTLPFTKNLIPSGSSFAESTTTNLPAEFSLSGDASFGLLGDDRDKNGHGIRFQPSKDIDSDDQHAGSVTATTKITADSGRWFRFRIRGLAQDNFQVETDDLYLQVEFFRDNGTNSLDHIKKHVYPLVEQDRKDLRDAGTNKNLGLATWRSFDLEFKTPFPEVDTLKLTAGFAHGVPAESKSEFWIAEFELTPIPVPADYVPPAGGKVSLAKDQLDSLVSLGGRWYFDPRGGSRDVPAKFDHTNADRLLYLTDKLEAPFADNTTAWLKAGFKDRTGKIVETDRFIPDNVVITPTSTHLVIQSKNLPNHPTAVFPDRWRAIDGNPNYIQEQDSTWYLPLVPRENPQHVAMNDKNSNNALPMGPIGLAVNGIVFFHPFDHLQGEDAVWRLDRCCGHPAPTAQYHYHKYPVCLKSPWSDDGGAHSPLIGFAFDGFPLFGPYEAAGQLAKDSKDNPLNDFNVHHDSDRGWHYHVTPGQYPHLIGGFWGFVDSRNRGQGGPPPGGKGPPPGKGDFKGKFKGNGPPPK